MLFANRLWARYIANKRARADYLLIDLSIETSSLFVLIAIIDEAILYARFDEAAFELPTKCVATKYTLVFFLEMLLRR